jgi:hypothetical protein
MDYNSTDMSELALRSVYLPPFKAALDAGALSVMSAFNDLNGVPTSGNRWLLTDILRGEWGFAGFVVSDYTSEQELIAHGYAADGRDAARLALMAGVDMSMKSGLFLKHIPDLVQSGDVPMARRRGGAAGADDQGRPGPVRQSLSRRRRAHRSAGSPAAASIWPWRARPGASPSSCSRTRATSCPCPRRASASP